MNSIELLEDERTVAKCYVELGNVTKEKGEYDESLRYHRKSMKIFERIDDALSVADSHLNIAEIYKVKGEFKQAMSEYEKGLALYEDVYVENSDSGTDVSLNSSSFSDLQHTKSLSKSEETLPHKTLVSTIEEHVPSTSSEHLLVESVDVSISSLNLINSNTTKKIGESERRKSLSASTLSDLPYINANDMLPPILPRDDDYQRTGDSTPDESDILEIALPSAYSTKQHVSELPIVNTKTNVDQSIKNTPNKRSYCLPNRTILILVASIFLTGVLYWSLNNFFIASSFDSLTQEKSSLNNSEDLSEQLRKILSWRKKQFIALNRDSREIIEEFLINSNSRSQMTLDKFQRILDMLELKLVLIPQ